MICDECAAQGELELADWRTLEDPPRHLCQAHSVMLRGVAHTPLPLREDEKR